MFMRTKPHTLETWFVVAVYVAISNAGGIFAADVKVERCSLQQRCTSAVLQTPLLVNSASGTRTIDRLMLKFPKPNPVSVALGYFTVKGVEGKRCTMLHIYTFYEI